MSTPGEYVLGAWLKYGRPAVEPPPRTPVEEAIASHERTVEALLSAHHSKPMRANFRTTPQMKAEWDAWWAGELDKERQAVEHLVERRLEESRRPT